ncbi:MAG: radical SAM protein, partial [Chloroflexi bacterium]|nr:radical SAM protein [Chloroflexota bacterium]
MPSTISANNINKIMRGIILRVAWMTPATIRGVIRRLVPKMVLLKYTTIYPIEIPDIKFLPGQDLILLELPQRYMPTMPNGLGYVHNLLKKTGIRFQTADLNVIMYHRYHSRRILGGLKKVISANGYVMPDNPWEAISADRWNEQETIDYFRPEIDEIIGGLVKARPKVIGISLSGTNRNVAREVVRGVRALYPEVIILIGGYDCVYHYVAPHVFPDYDYMVIGEAELTLPPLIKALLDGEKPSDMPGVISKNDSPDRIWVAGDLLKDLDSIDFPRYDWTDITLYRTYHNGTTVPIISSRGCHWSRCRFCCECFTWRRRSPAKVVDEMEWFNRQGRTDFLFNESDMNGDPDALLEICDEILKRRLKIGFSGELRVDKRGTPEFFQRLREAGCQQLAFGVDGWTDHTLRLENKGYTMDMVEENLRNCHNAGIFVRVNMVIGVPGETEEDVTESIHNILALKDYIDCFQNLNILILGAGNAYYLNPEQFGIHFRGDKQELYRKHPSFIPPELWY